MVAIRFVGISLALLVLAGAGACGASTPTASGLAGLPTSTTTATTPGTVPVLIDTDMAADDIIAIAVPLRDPAVAVRAITVDGTGEVHCSAGIPNALRLLNAFGVTGVKVGCGRETPGPGGRSFPAEWRAAVDDMYGIISAARIRHDSRWRRGVADQRSSRSERWSADHRCAWPMDEHC